MTRVSAANPGGKGQRMSGNGKAGAVLLIVENLPVPRDRRVWQEALALRDGGWEVSVICPRRPACPEPYVVLDGIHVFRHWLPEDGAGLWNYPAEYAIALFWQFVLPLRSVRPLPSLSQSWPGSPSQGPKPLALPLGVRLRRWR